MHKARAIVITGVLAIGLPLGVVAGIAESGSVPQASAPPTPDYFYHAGGNLSAVQADAGPGYFYHATAK